MNDRGDVPDRFDPGVIKSAFQPIACRRGRVEALAVGVRVGTSGRPASGWKCLEDPSLQCRLRGEKTPSCAVRDLRLPAAIAALWTAAWLWTGLNCRGNQRGFPLDSSCWRIDTFNVYGLNGGATQEGAKHETSCTVVDRSVLWDRWSDSGGVHLGHRHAALLGWYGS